MACQHWAGCRPIVQISAQKDQWPLYSWNVNPMDYRMLGATLEAYHKLKTKPKTIAKLEKHFRLSGATWHKDISTRLWKTCEIKRLKPWVEAWSWWWTFEHSRWQWNSGIWSLINCVVLTMLLNWCSSLNIFECWKIGRRLC